MRPYGQGRVYLRGKTWWIRYYVDGKRYDESSRSKKEKDAINLLEERRVAARKGEDRPEVSNYGWDELQERGMRYFRRKNKSTTAKRRESSVRHLRDFFGRFKVRNIDHDAIERYMERRTEEGIAEGTIKYEVSTLRKMLKEARRAKKLKAMPEFPEIGDPDNARQGFFTEAEFGALLAEMPEHHKPWVGFAYWSGWRVRSEILTRKWEHVDFGRGVIRLNPGETKNKDGRELPFDVIPELDDVLRRQRAYTDKWEAATGETIPWVFHNRGKQIKGFQKTWERARERAGCPDRIPHDFRRTAVRRLAEGGVDRGTAKAIVGHKTDAMYERYNIQDVDRLRDGLRKIANDREPDLKVLPFSKEA